MNKLEELKQFLDLVADEVNVENVDIRLSSKEGGRIIYNRELRKFRQ